jgi:hypothetical protein
MSDPMLDAAGRRRSPATLPEFHAGRPPRNKGMRYPADPPTIEEIVTVMRSAGDGVHGRRLRGLIVVLWRAGLRICEALALAEADLDARRGSLLMRRGRGGRRREVGMDDWAWEQLAPWLDVRVELPVGPLFCVVNGATRGRPWAAAARTELRRVAREAGVRRRFAPHQLRHAHAVEMAREGVPLIVIQRQLGHTNLGITLDLSPGHRQHRDHRHRPRPPRADGPRTQPARALRPRPAAGKPTTAAGPHIQIASPGPAVASGSLSAPLIAKERSTRRQRPTPLSRSSTHPAIRLSCAGRRMQQRAFCAAVRSRRCPVAWMGAACPSLLPLRVDVANGHDSGGARRPLPSCTESGSLWRGTSEPDSALLALG